MSKFTKTTLQKLENVFEQLEYKVRYEKGNFHSGYCIVEDRKIAVINKFFDIEGRVTTLLEILRHIPFDPNQLDEPGQKILSRFSHEQVSLL